MKRKILFYIFFVSITGMLVSCENYKDCNAPVQTALGIGFYQMVNGTQQDSTLPALTMFGIGRADTPLSDKSPSSTIYIPLNQNMDTSAFFIQPDSSSVIGDTVIVKYKRSLQFVSSGCGFTTFYNIDTVYSTNHFIDSIALTTKSIVTTNAINVQIYY
ncbi:MAG: DUF6452 family protein [Chitinophagaceae bacterium]